MPRGRPPKRETTQLQWIIDQLASGRQLDQQNAMSEFGIRRLASRVCDIDKNAPGWVEHFWVATADGNGYQGYRARMGAPMPDFKRGEGPQGCGSVLFEA